MPRTEGGKNPEQDPLRTAMDPHRRNQLPKHRDKDNRRRQAVYQRVSKSFLEAKSNGQSHDGHLRELAAVSNGQQERVSIQNQFLKQPAAAISSFFGEYPESQRRESSDREFKYGQEQEKKCQYCDEYG